MRGWHFQECDEPWNIVGNLSDVASSEVITAEKWGLDSFSMEKWNGNGIHLFNEHTNKELIIVASGHFANSKEIQGL